MQNQLENLIAELDQVIDDVLADLNSETPDPIANAPTPANITNKTAKLALQTDIMQKRLGVIGQRDVPLDRQSYYDAIDAVQTLNSDENDG